MVTLKNIFINKCMRDEFSLIDLMVDTNKSKKKWVYTECQVSTVNPTFPPPTFTSPYEGWIVPWPQKGEIGEQTVSGELGE